MELGELPFEEFLKLEPKDAFAYMLLSDIYAAAEMWKETSLVHRKMQERGILKEPRLKLD